MTSTFHNKLALVTGASSGIGEWFARHLARQGASLVLVARREDRLARLKAELETPDQVVHFIAMDLQAPGAAQTLWEKIHAKGLLVDVLINNAGFGKHGEFLQVDLQQHRDLVQLNIAALTELTWLFARDMKQRGTGKILLVSSIAAYVPVPDFATYAASKAYVLSFGQALHNELKPHGVDVTVLSPGAVATEFMDISGQDLTDWRRHTFMTPDKVGSVALKALARARRVIIPGLLLQLSVTSMRLIPNRLQMLLGRMATQ